MNLWQSKKGQAFLAACVMCIAGFFAPVGPDVQLTLAAAVAAGLPVLLAGQSAVDREHAKRGPQ